VWGTPPTSSAFLILGSLPTAWQGPKDGDLEAEALTDLDRNRESGVPH